MNASRASAADGSKSASLRGSPQRAIVARLLSSGLLAILAGGTTGCISVHIADSTGQVQTIRQFGLLKVEMANPQQSIVGSMTGVGVIDAPLGWSVGYTRQRWALMGPECRAVFWAAPGSAIDENTRIELAQVAGVCLIQDETTSLSTSLTEVTP
ncbi:hypothetical protein [Variovorax sp. J22R115]|uniref:hypothetical protein n=1 Tax=Variovorax sp. J22R115 TaxID=3053509 RepID=UPI0025773AA4|nr:hypothetical protein [Variovorax sp. J22R115]MDM0053009.1 hypothetical protein [Variovorax sp. J22R115]